MAVICPECSTKVPARAVNLDRMIAKCESCDEVFRFESQLGQRGARARTPRPLSITVEGELAPEPSFGDATYRLAASPAARGPLRLSYRWFRPMALFMLAFSVVWCGFLVVFYAGLIAGRAPLFAFLFPLLHVAVGVGLGYSALAQLVNRTVIAIEGSTLSVHHGPLPWLHSPRVEIDCIRQLFVRRRVARGKNGSTVTYALCADVEGTAIDLVRGLATEDEARYLAQAIERHLGIEDDPSAGDG